MTTEMILVLGVIAIALALFIWERFPVDLVAIGASGVLIALGVLTPREGLSGFSNAAVITVGSLFVVSAGLQRTGALQAVTRILMRVGDKPFALLVPMMLMAALGSAFINNTSLVAVSLPMIMAVCVRHDTPPSKLLIPLSFASQFGGVCTLIGTSTNLLVSSLSDRAGYGSIGMFEFTRLGIILVAVGTLYFVLAGYWLLPTREREDLTHAYKLKDYITELRVLENSPIVGKTTVESELKDREDVRLLEILRDDKKIWSPTTEVIRKNDVLLVQGQVKSLMALKDTLKLELIPKWQLQDAQFRTEDQTLVQALVPRGSRYIGRTLAQLNFVRYHNAFVLAIQQRAQTVREKMDRVPLRFGDVLLLLGPKREIERLRAEDDLVVLDEVETASLRKGRAPLALAIAASVIALAALNILPILTAALLGAVAMVGTRCILVDEAYHAIDWKVILLLAGVVPMGVALEKTGTASFLVDQVLPWMRGYGAIGALAFVYLFTLVLTEFLSNNASAALMVPIAISTAERIEVAAMPFLMAVAFAASTSFATPIGYQTNLMVYSPGGYRYSDYLKVGVPLDILFAIVALTLIPWFWPF